MTLINVNRNIYGYKLFADKNNHLFFCVHYRGASIHAKVNVIKYLHNITQDYYSVNLDALSSISHIRIPCCYDVH